MPTQGLTGEQVEQLPILVGAVWELAGHTGCHVRVTSVRRRKGVPTVWYQHLAGDGRRVPIWQERFRYRCRDFEFRARYRLVSQPGPKWRDG